MKILAFLEHPWEVDLLVRQMKEKSGDQWTVFCADASTQSELRRRNILFTTEADYHFPETAEGVSARAYELSESWWHSFYESEPLLNAGGVNVPALIERDAVYFFLWILRSISFVQSLLKHLAPGEILAGEKLAQPKLYFRSGRDESLFGQIAKDLAREQNIPFTLLQAPWAEHLRSGISSQVLISTFRMAGHRLRERLARRGVSFSDYGRTFFKDLIAALSLKIMRQTARRRKDSRPVLLVSSSEVHVAPVLAELRNRGECKMVHLRETFSPKQGRNFLKKGESFRTLSLKRCGHEGRGLWRFWEKQGAEILSNQNFAWKGYAFGHLMKEKFTFLFEALFPALIHFRRNAEKILKEERVAEILVEEDVCLFNKTLIRTANLLGIPSVVIQHGFSVLRVGFYPLSATKFAAFGNAARRRLMEWGIDEERIMIVGNVLHDKKNKELPSRAEFCSALGLDPAKKIFVLGMFPYRDYSNVDFPEVESYARNYFPLVETAAEALSAFPDAQLVVKLHPRDSRLKECSLFVQKFKKIKVVVTQSHPSLHYSANCDAMITVLSTLLIDTLPFKKPMIVVDFSGQDARKTQEMISMDIPVIPNDSSLLAAEIRKILSGNDSARLDRLAQDHLSQMDGQASKRAADLVQSLFNPVPVKAAAPLQARFV